MPGGQSPKAVLCVFRTLCSGSRVSPGWRRCRPRHEGGVRSLRPPGNTTACVSRPSAHLRARAGIQAEILRARPRDRSGRAACDSSRFCAGSRVSPSSVCFDDAFLADFDRRARPPPLAGLSVRRGRVNRTDRGVTVLTVASAALAGYLHERGGYAYSRETTMYDGEATAPSALTCHPTSTATMSDYATRQHRRSDAPCKRPLQVIAACFDETRVGGLACRLSPRTGQLRLRQSDLERYHPKTWLDVQKGGMK